MTRTLVNLCRRLHISWLRVQRAQMMLAADQLALDNHPEAALLLAMLMARAAAVRCEIAAIEHRIAMPPEQRA